MSIVIVGAGGFLGSHLAAHFRAKRESVHALSYRPAQHASFLAALPAMLQAVAPSAFVIAGGSQNGRDDPASLTELALSNTLLPAAIASLLRTHAPDCRLLTFGSSWQWGEDGTSTPFNAYAASKTAAEAFLAHFALAGLRCATLRLFDTYGPGDTRGKVVSLIAKAIAARSDLPMSAGGQMIELVHIRDVLAAVDATLAELDSTPAAPYRVYAVRSGQPVTVLQVLETMLRLAGIENDGFIRPGIYPYRPRERFELFADTPVPPGWQPKVLLQDGLRALLEEHMARESRHA
jgi:nucleoside-diphosphate-sugar epimerase